MVFESGWSVNLVAVAVLSAFACFALIGRRLPPLFTWSVTLCRIGLTLSFFAIWRERAWTLLDDEKYFNQGQVLVSRGLDPVGVFFTREGLGWLLIDSRGPHILYGWFNLFAQWLLGPHYYAPVFLNVVLSFAAARLLYDIIMLVQANRTYAATVCAAFLLHWDVVAWSSFLNLKDTLVLTMTMLLALGYMWVPTPRRRMGIGVIALMSFLFLWLRFYVPVVLALCFLVTSVLGDAQRLRSRLRLMAFGAVALLAVVAVVGPGLLALAWSRIDLSPTGILPGVARILLTPQPWSVTASNGFLLLPSMLHLAFLPAAVIGYVLLWREFPAARLVVLYAVVTLGIFAVFPLQLGPRHRYQLAFVTIWAQVHALWHLAVLMRRERLQGAPPLATPQTPS